MTEAHGDGWPEEVKISLLKSKLNPALKVALANNHLLPSGNYYEWLRIVGQIAQQHDELHKDSTIHQFFAIRGEKSNQRAIDRNPENDVPDFSAREISVSGKEKGYVGDVDSNGDTFMGGINSAQVLRGPNGKPLRARWKSPEQIKRLKEENRCYRCERKGCSTKTCKILPAVNPNTNKKIISVANIEPLNLDLFDEDENDVDSGRYQVISEN